MHTPSRPPAKHLRGFAPPPLPGSGEQGGEPKTEQPNSRTPPFRGGSKDPPPHRHCLKKRQRLRPCPPMKSRCLFALLELRQAHRSKPFLRARTRSKTRARMLVRPGGGPRDRQPRAGCDAYPAATPAPATFEIDRGERLRAAVLRRGVSLLKNPHVGYRYSCRYSRRYSRRYSIHIGGPVSRVQRLRLLDPGKHGLQVGRSGSPERRRPP